uniref:Fibrinogen C-terminal domain-containing protein n=1 Tax=Anopheles atroparvus TaxID=41427 RepID=A0AAG5DLE4_ANOAO
MRFQNPLFQVLCLVITVILYPTATADHDAFSIDTYINYKMQNLEQTIMRKLETHLEQHSNHVIEKLAALTTKVQQIADSNQNLRNITDNLLVGQRELQQQLTSVKDDLQYHRSKVEQEKANEKEFHKFQNSTNAQHEEVIETLAALTTNVQQLAESFKNLQKISDNLVANQPQVEQQLTNINNVLYENSKTLILPSCATLNINETGAYSIRPAGVVEPFLVLCDFEDNFELGGGWTVFQRRFNGAVNFYRNWTMYKNGFGDVNGEHWLGLEKLHVMTRSGRHEMLVILENHEGNTTYALYDSFQIGSEAEKYKLTIGNYSGTAGDSLSCSNGANFSTFDQDNDPISDLNRAQDKSGAWWFNAYLFSHLNGTYRRKGERRITFREGVIWVNWKGPIYSLKSTKMMVRRRSE